MNAAVPRSRDPRIRTDARGRIVLFRTFLGTKGHARERTMAPNDPRKLLNSKILGLAGVDSRKSKWGAHAAYFVDGREFVHFHARREVDIRLPGRFQKLGGSKLNQDSRIGFPEVNSDWIAFALST